MSVSRFKLCALASRRRWLGAAGLSPPGFRVAPPRPPSSYAHGREYFSQAKYGHASPKVIADGRACSQRRRAISCRPPLYDRWSHVLSVRDQSLHGGRHGILVRRGLPWPTHRQWRSLRHGLADSRPSDAAAAVLCAGDEPQQRLFGHRARQRSGALSRRPGDGRLLPHRRCPGFKGAGTAKIKVEYVGRAPLEGSDDNALLASLRTDGSPANLTAIRLRSW